MQIPGFHLAASFSAVPWRSTRLAGIYWLPLDPACEPSADDGGRDAAVLIRMDPGRGYPEHIHRGVEDVLVLAGAYRDERGEHCAGTYVRYEPGSRHAPIAIGNRELPIGPDNPACVLFAVARDGVELVRPA